MNKITDAMVEAAMRETPFIPNENNQAWMVRALSAAISLAPPVEPVAWTSVDQIAMLRLPHYSGVGNVDAKTRPVLGFDQPLYAAPPEDPDELEKLRSALLCVEDAIFGKTLHVGSTEYFGVRELIRTALTTIRGTK